MLSVGFCEYMQCAIYGISLRYAVCYLWVSLGYMQCVVSMGISWIYAMWYLWVSLSICSVLAVSNAVSGYLWVSVSICSVLFVDICSVLSAGISWIYAVWVSVGISWISRN